MKLRKRPFQNSALLWVALAGLLWLPNTSEAQEAVTTFRQSCMSCHTVGGGRLVGPDLKNVEERKDRAWLVGFIMDPKGVLASGDPYALQLKDEAAGVVMPPIVGLTRERAEAILDLIAAESALEASQFAGLDIGDLSADPIEQFERWYTDAEAAELWEPNALVVSAVDADGWPSSRYVLLKDFDHRGFSF